MSETELTGPITTALEAIKATTELLDTAKIPHPRAGPLVIVGRFYISLTVILAVVASTAAIIDWKTAPHDPSFSVSILRLAVIIAVTGGLLLSVVLIGILLFKHVMYLFNPSELTPETLQSLMSPRSKEVALATAIVAPASAETPKN